MVADGDAPAITGADFPNPAMAWDAALVERNESVESFIELGSTGSGGTNVYRAVATLP